MIETMGDLAKRQAQPEEILANTSIEELLANGSDFGTRGMGLGAALPDYKGATCHREERMK